MSTGTNIEARTPLRVGIRWMVRRDLPEVLAIEHASFEDPLCEEEILRHLRRRDCIGMVAENGEGILGFMVYELGKGTITLLDLAVLPASRRRGVGRHLVEKLVGKLSEGRRTRVVADVRESHLGGHLFLRERGFRAVRVLPGKDGAEDAYRFVYTLADGCTGR